MFNCKEPEMVAYKNKLYKHIYTCLIEQGTQYISLEMIQAALSKDTFFFCHKNTLIFGDPPDKNY